MMMTAAGTVAPAKVIMGVGVAGLQAIATAKRMGAITATCAATEQVNLGGRSWWWTKGDEDRQTAETTPK